MLCNYLVIFATSFFFLKTLSYFFIVLGKMFKKLKKNSSINCWNFPFFQKIWAGQFEKPQILFQRFSNQ